MTSSFETITGKSVAWIRACPTQAWLGQRGLLQVPPDDPYIRTGSHYHKDRYGERRSLDLGSFGKADWTTGEQTSLVIHEACRSLRHADPKIGQLQHYLWAAQRIYGIVARGMLHQPKGHTIEVSLDVAATERDHEALCALQDTPCPTPRRIPICGGCTNRFWCWG